MLPDPVGLAHDSTLATGCLSCYLTLFSGPPVRPMLATQHVTFLPTIQQLRFCDYHPARLTDRSSRAYEAPGATLTTEQARRAEKDRRQAENAAPLPTRPGLVAPAAPPRA